LSISAVDLVWPAAWQVASQSSRLSGQGASRPSFAHQSRAIGNRRGYSACLSSSIGSGYGASKYRYCPAPYRLGAMSMVERNSASSP
jgi:hypothetical protein